MILQNKQTRSSEDGCCVWWSVTNPNGGLHRMISSSYVPEMALTARQYPTILHRDLQAPRNPILIKICDLACAAAGSVTG